jgi:hypothetical protein
MSKFSAAKRAYLTAIFGEETTALLEKESEELEKEILSSGIEWKEYEEKKMPNKSLREILGELTSIRDSINSPVTSSDSQADEVPSLESLKAAIEENRKEYQRAVTLSRSRKSLEVGQTERDQAYAIGRARDASLNAQANEAFTVENERLKARALGRPSGTSDQSFRDAFDKVDRADAGELQRLVRMGIASGDTALLRACASKVLESGWPFGAASLAQLSAALPELKKYLDWQKANAPKSRNPFGWS